VALEAIDNPHSDGSAIRRFKVQTAIRARQDRSGHLRAYFLCDDLNFTLSVHWVHTYPRGSVRVKKGRPWYRAALCSDAWLSCAGSGELAPEVGLTTESRFVPRRFPPTRSAPFRFTVTEVTHHRSYLPEVRVPIHGDQTAVCASSSLRRGVGGGLSHLHLRHDERSLAGSVDADEGVGCEPALGPWGGTAMWVPIVRGGLVRA
jgi:hypothetical protein